jgi:hypothetical protein
VQQIDEFVSNQHQLVTMCIELLGSSTFPLEII